jgi:uncharacterized protein YukE
MRTPRVVLVALLLLLGGCAKSTSTSSTKAAPTTTTTTDPVDRVAVDVLIDQVAPAFKPVLKAESGEVPARELTASAQQMAAIADGLKDPAKRPRGVPPKVLDDLGTALAQTSAAAAEIAPTAQGCAGASNPRCADLYLKLNQGQTALINAYQALAQFGTRTPDAVQSLLYT